MFQDILISGLINSGVYALLALGFSLIFGVARIVNIAHTAFYMLAAYALYGLLVIGGMPLLLAIPLAVLGPRAPKLAVALVAAYTAASFVNPLAAFSESAVAVVLLGGVVAVLWWATGPGSRDLAMHLPSRSAAGVSGA